MGGDEASNPDAKPVFAGMWDVATGKLVRHFDTGSAVTNIEISADGSTLITYPIPGGGTSPVSMDGGVAMAAPMLEPPMIEAPTVAGESETPPETATAGPRTIWWNLEDGEIAREFPGT